MQGRMLAAIAVTALMLGGCGQKTEGPAGGPVSSAEVAQDASQASTALDHENRERYKENPISPVHAVAEAPVSTFAVDVDTGAYANVRRLLVAGQTPPKDAVRTEELVNYFRYDYPIPGDRTVPFSVTTDVAQTPWNPDTRLIRIGLRGYDVNADRRPPANLVFLVDVSGSMNEPDKLPLVKTALSTLADNLRPEDHVAIVVYAGAAGLVLDPTSDPSQIKAALGQLQAGGSTAGGEGIQLAYAVARQNFRKDGINRVLLATDGDFNVGVTDPGQLEQLIEQNRDDGITLTTLGFGAGNFNDALMEGLADKGNGNYAYVDSAMEAQKVLGDELSATLFTIAKDVKVQVEFNPAYVSEYRLIGYENRALRDEDFANDKVDAGDIGAGHQVTALYEVVPAGARGWLPDRHFAANQRAETGATNGQLAQVKLRYKLPGSETSRLIEQPVAANLLTHAPAPSGDMAFATAVAAFEQKLRGDAMLGGLDYAAIRKLAGPQTGYWRAEFLKLTQLAETRSPATASNVAW